MVVKITTMTTGPRKLPPRSPSAVPLLATISATSPREIIPTPITFVTIATMTSTTENQIIAGVISGSTTFNPILAKNTGDNNI